VSQRGAHRENVTCAALQIHTLRTFTYTLRKPVSIDRWLSAARPCDSVHPRGIDRWAQPYVAYSTYTDLRRCAGFFYPAV